MMRLVLAALLLLAGCPHLPSLPEEASPDPAYVACQEACLLEPGVLYQICLQTCRTPRQPAPSR